MLALFYDIDWVERYGKHAMTQSNLMPAACMVDGQTLRQQLQLATQYLMQQQVDEARDNAELLMLHLLQVSRAQLLMQWQELFPSQLLNSWGQMLYRKGQGEPVQYIIGEAWFYGRPFQVSPAVLIPRPETELLVEAVLTHAQRHWQNEALHVLDVGTGSGAIAITLQLEQPKWQVIASDLSEKALQQAHTNAEFHHVTSSIQWVQGDLLKPFSQEAGRLTYNGQRIDVLVSNPPYIPIGDLTGLQREVKQYEPHLALFGGEDGLNLYREMVDCLRDLEEHPRIVAFELGIHQPEIVAQWLRDIGAWNEVEIITDYNGIQRHVIAIKS